MLLGKLDSAEARLPKEPKMGGKTLKIPSRSGTPPMGVDNYSLCAIIDACSKGGVSSLKFRDVEIQFGAPVQKTFEYAYGPAESEVAPKRAPAFDEDLREEMRLEQLLIDDPHGFENEIITSHLSR